MIRPRGYWDTAGALASIASKRVEEGNRLILSMCLDWGDTRWGLITLAEDSMLRIERELL